MTEVIIAILINILILGPVFYFWYQFFKDVGLKKKHNRIAANLYHNGWHIWISIIFIIILIASH